MFGPPPQRLLIVLVLGSAPVSAAWATCPASPQNFAAHDCEVDYYGTPRSVCSTDSVAFECDVSWSEDDAAVTIVSDFDTSVLVPYEAWGSVEVDGVVSLFCCASGPQFTPTMVHIEGSDYADVLEFTWSALSYNLDGVGGAIAATIDGNDGPDVVNGSHEAGTTINETLNGGPCSATLAVTG
ncbi:MAG: hypothetical protein ACK4YP_00700 [Myxococcota bacterium]